MAELTRLWRENSGDLPNVVSVQFREPKVGPAGRAIEIRLSGNNLQDLSQASWELQNWLRGYDGVSNLLDDLRPGKPEYTVQLKHGALAAGVDARSISSQLRAAYQGIKISDIYRQREAYEIIAKLDSNNNCEIRTALGDDAEKSFYLETIVGRGYRFLEGRDGRALFPDTTGPVVGRESELRQLEDYHQLVADWRPRAGDHGCRWPI